MDFRIQVKSTLFFTASLKIIDFSFIVTCTHQKIITLFCCINFDYYKKFHKKCFSFYLFSFEYIKKIKIHTKFDCASKFTLTPI